MTNYKEEQKLELSIEEIRFEMQERIKDEIFEQITAEIKIKEKSCRQQLSNLEFDKN